LGLRGIRVDDPAAIGDAWDQALSADRPALVEAVTDPNVPPLPPHITLEQAKEFASSIWSRDAESLGFIKQTIKDAAENFLPHKQ
jgi:pyruvate dehydrogenase (quinone)